VFTAVKALSGKFRTVMSLKWPLSAKRCAGRNPDAGLRLDQERTSSLGQGVRSAISMDSHSTGGNMSKRIASVIAVALLLSCAAQDAKSVLTALQAIGRRA
jgi:hypothetical protein